VDNDDVDTALQGDLPERSESTFETIGLEEEKAVTPRLVAAIRTAVTALLVPRFIGLILRLDCRVKVVSN